MEDKYIVYMYENIMMKPIIYNKYMLIKVFNLH